MTRILAFGYDSGPAGGPGAGVSAGPGFLPQVAGTGSCWSGGLREGVDTLPCLGDLLSPWPVRGDLESFAACAADEAGSCVENPVTDRFRLGSGEVAVEGEQLQPGEQGLGGHGGGQPRLVDVEVVGGEMPESGVLAGADRVFDPGVDAVACVDVGGLAAPAFGFHRQAGDPQGVPPAVRGFHQGEFRAGVGALAAGEDPHFPGPAAGLVAAGAFAQQPGQLGDVRFLDPAGPVAALHVAAGLVGAALADLAFPVDGDLPSLLGDQPDRGLLPVA